MINSGIEENLISTKDFHYNEKESIFYIEINKEQKNKKKTLIFFHGFGGACFLFFWLISLMFRDHYIVSFDWPGTNLSIKDDSI